MNDPVLCTTELECSKLIRHPGCRGYADHCQRGEGWGTEREILPAQARCTGKAAAAASAATAVAIAATAAEAVAAASTFPVQRAPAAAAETEREMEGEYPEVKDLPLGPHSLSPTQDMLLGKWLCLPGETPLEGGEWSTIPYAPSPPTAPDALMGAGPWQSHGGGILASPHR